MLTIAFQGYNNVRVWADSNEMSFCIADMLKFGPLGIFDIFIVFPLFIRRYSFITAGVVIILYQYTIIHPICVGLKIKYIADQLLTVICTHPNYSNIAIKMDAIVVLLLHPSMSYMLKEYICFIIYVDALSTKNMHYPSLAHDKPI